MTMWIFVRDGVQVGAADRDHHPRCIDAWTAVAGPDGCGWWDAIADGVTAYEEDEDGNRLIEVNPLAVPS